MSDEEAEYEEEKAQQEQLEQDLIERDIRLGLLDSKHALKYPKRPEDEHRNIRPRDRKIKEKA